MPYVSDGLPGRAANVIGNHRLRRALNELSVDPQNVAKKIVAEYGLNASHASEIDVRTADELRRNLGECEKWLRSKVRGRPYVLLLPKGKDAITQVRSQDWLAHRVIDALGFPTKIARAGDPRGPRDPVVYVVLDDAVYSGTQMNDIIRQWLHAQRRSNDRPRICSLFIAAAYVSTQARAFLVQNMEVYERDRVYDPRRQHIDLFAPTEFRGFKTVMPHKVPDHLSFDPFPLRARPVHALTSRVRSSIVKEPYKTIIPRKARHLPRDAILFVLPYVWAFVRLARELRARSEPASWRRELVDKFTTGMRRGEVAWRSGDGCAVSVRFSEDHPSRSMRLTVTERAGATTSRKWAFVLIVSYDRDSFIVLRQGAEDANFARAVVAIAREHGFNPLAVVEE